MQSALAMIFSSAGAWLCASTRTQEGSKADSPTRRDTSSLMKNEK